MSVRLVQQQHLSSSDLSELFADGHQTDRQTEKLLLIVILLKPCSSFYIVRTLCYYIMCIVSVGTRQVGAQRKLTGGSSA